jgi:hypothetical protein
MVTSTPCCLSLRKQISHKNISAPGNAIDGETFRLMKLLLKLLLFLSILLAAMYATTPLWIAYIVASQLPPGWQLEKLESGYPGASEINIQSLHVKGALPAAELNLTAVDLRFNYRKLTTEIGSVSLDVYLRATESNAANTLSLDELSLPVTKLTGKMPGLFVGQMSIALHHDMKMEAADPLVLNFRSLNLTPLAGGSYQITSNTSFKAAPGVSGSIDIDATPELLKAEVRFPEDTNAPPWLTVKLLQESLATANSTSVHAVLNTEPADNNWLDSLLMKNTAGKFSHMTGSLELHAGFAGQDLQEIEHLSLATDNLMLTSDKGILNLKTQLSASREDENIIVNFPSSTEILYQDNNGWIDQLITSAIPDFQRLPRLEAQVAAQITSNSRLMFQPVKGQPASFSGGISFDFSSSGEVISLLADDIHIEMENFPALDAINVDGEVKVDWSESTAFTYTTSDLELASEEMSVTAFLRTQNGKVISTGNATFLDGKTPLYATSAERIDMTWQDLDLLDMTGKLTTKTQGFGTDLGDERWSGFNFDVSYDLLSDAGISGLGTLNFDSGALIPLEFTGNWAASRWDINIPATTIKLVEFDKLLPVAHIDLPESIKLIEGDINIKGDVKVADEITAKMTISGDQLAASMRKSIASKANFSFGAGYGQHLFASGPISIDNIEIAAGIDLSYIRADLNLESTETIGLQNLYAELFDGHLTVGEFRYANDRIEDTTILLKQINLGQLLAYIDTDGLDGTGSLDFALPVGSDESGFYVRNGTFKSDGPGYLAYAKEGLAGSNIGLQALENFQYQDLSGTIDYQASGEYHIGIHLEGKNPDLYGGHPISFNLNINGSLPALFEALFITGSFEEKILQGFKITR